MKTFKKILCSLLVVVMCLTSAPLQGFVGMKWPDLPEINFGEFELPKIDFSSWFGGEASAISSSGSCGENVTYTYNSSTKELIISGIGEMTNYVGTVTASPFYDSDVEKVIFKEGVTSVGNYSFMLCKKLKEVILPDSINVIGEASFNVCSSLSSIDIPNNVTEIGGVAFNNCTSLISVDIPSSVKCIGIGAFVGCTNLEEVSMNNGLIDIGTGAFKNCKKLTNITIPEGVISLGEEVFNQCTNLDNIYIPDSVNSIGPFAFMSTKYYNNVSNWEDNVLYINNHFIMANYISGKYAIKNGTVTIADTAFYQCSNLNELTIPKSVKGIGPNAFINCDSLTDVYYLGSESDWNKIHNIAGVYFPSNSIVHFNDDSTHDPSSDGQCGENVFWKYNKNTGELIISGIGPMSDYSFNNMNIKSVVIENGVTTIGHFAFESCENLCSIIIPQSVTMIGSSAFNGCVSLDNILLPDCLTDIGHRAFYNCTSLTEITIPNSVTNIGEEAFSGCINLSKLELSENLTRIESSVFYNCSALTEIVIPNGVTYIGYDAFLGCDKIKKITIPASTDICNGAFKDCLFVEDIYITKGSGMLYGRALGDRYNSFSYTPWYISKSENLIVILEEGITTIGDSAFRECVSIKDISIPNSVTHIGVGAFDGCTNLNQITIPASASICPDAFDECLAIGEITISKGSGKMNEFTDYYSYEYTPWYVARNNDLSIVVSDGITNIVANAFKDCVGLKRITLPEDLITIGAYSFAGCSNITNIIIPDSVTTIGICAFSSCTKMNSITIPAGIEMFSGSFSSCKPSEVVITKGKENLYTNSDANAIPWKNAKKVVIEYGVTAIGNEVFANCKNIENISIPNSVTYIGEGAFNGCEMLEQIDLPDKIVDICPDTFKNCYSLIKIDLPQDLTCIGSNAFYGCKNLLELIVPENAESIGDNAFYNCSSLFNISIPDSINSIGECAFYGCSSISSIKIPRDLRIVNNGTFDSCKNLSNLDLGDNIEKIGNRAFAVCTNLTDVVIPDSVMEIGDYAFSGCTNMVSLKISDSVTNIGDYSFYNCSKLTDISIPASAYYSKNTFENCTAINNVIISKGTGTMVEFSSGESSGSPWYTSESDSISVTIKYGVKNIRNLAFSGCTGLKNITIPNSVNDIGEFSFANCTGLTDVAIPYDVKNIGAYAFNGCSNLKELRIGKEISTIGIHAFANCTSLKDIYYDGSEDEWNIITKGKNVVDPSYTTIHYNSDNTGSSGDGTPTYSENFKFDKEAYTVKYNALTDETYSGFITLTYKADASILENFNADTIDFTVSDPSILEFKRTLYLPSSGSTVAFIYPSVEVKKLGTTTLTATLPDGTTASCEIVVEEYMDNVKRYIQVNSTNKSLSAEVGETFKMGFCLVEDGYVNNQWKKVSFVISDPSIISVKIKSGNWGAYNDKYIFEVTGLKAGSTNVIVTDSDTGTYEMFRISVYEPYTSQYTYHIEGIESFYPIGRNEKESNIETNFYNFNGLYVNNYQWMEQNGKYWVSFDVYNQMQHIGSVDVFDENGEWYNSYEIKKTKLPVNFCEVGEDVYYLVNDILEGDLLTYERETHTHLLFDVPMGGYFTISNNYKESIGTYLFNACEMLFVGLWTALDLATADTIDASEYTNAIKAEILANPDLKKEFLKVFLGTVKSKVQKISEDVVDSKVEDAFVSSTGLLEDIFNEIKINWKGTFKTVANISQSVLEKITGPVGATVKMIFAGIKMVNLIGFTHSFVSSVDAPYVTIHTRYNGEYESNGIQVEANGKIDSEAQLQVFRVASDNENVDCFDVQELELYNICFVKDDKLVQPNGKVKVYIPIPENMKSDTCKVYRQENDGSWTVLIVQKEGKFLVFETDHFSLYAITGEKQTISVETKPNKTTYLVNDVLDSTGLTLKVGDEIIDSGFICSPSVLSKNGKQTITVTYMGLTAEFKVEVNTKTSSDDDYQVGDIIQFGSYPQSKVTDSATISALNKLAPEWESWTSYGYYSSDNAQIKQGDWMRYTDIIYNGDRYRGVKFTKYRSSEFDQEASIYTYQDGNGYYVNEVYWFKFEPICWRVLDSDTGLIMCESIIDSQPFNNLYYENNGEYFNDTTYKKYASDYETSSIRKWLHENFYNTAFTENEKKEIDITVLNNDGYLTSSGSPGYEKYDGDNTSDKIFCLSYNDAKNDKYGFNSDSYTEDVTRRASGSDYAKSQGLDVENDGYSRWLLRSPYTHRSNCLVNHNGWSATMAFVSYTSSGVRPALTLKDLSNLDKEDHIHDYIKNVVSPTCEEDGYTQFKCKCGDTYVYDYVTAKGHSYSVKTIRPTCTENGTTTYTCACGDAYTETISATGHTFDESESKCKNCDYDKADDCSCNCHKGGIKAFFFKLILFFKKIFKKNKICNCGKYHY